MSELFEKQIAREPLRQLISLQDLVELVEGDASRETSLCPK